MARVLVGVKRVIDYAVKVISFNNFPLTTLRIFSYQLHFSSPWTLNYNWQHNWMIEFCNFRFV